MYKISTINDTLFYKEKILSNISLMQLKKLIDDYIYFITLKVQKMLKEES